MGTLDLLSWIVDDMRQVGLNEGRDISSAGTGAQGAAATAGGLTCSPPRPSARATGSIPTPSEPAPGARRPEVLGVY
jgi:hypothetical protein